VQPLADEKNISIKVHHHTDLQEFCVDSTRLSQISLNLLHNAIKFSPKGGTINIETNLQPDRLEFNIRDEGPGIPREERDHIFEMFSQGAHGNSHRSSSGLGLSIVHRNVQFLKGVISIEDAEPNGAVFKVSIPLEPLEPGNHSETSCPLN